MRAVFAGFVGLESLDGAYLAFSLLFSGSCDKEAEKLALFG